jgi:hypothetical protein
MTRVYVKDEEAFATCPERGTDIDIWLYCVRCPEYWNCFDDEWLSDVIRDAEAEDPALNGTKAHPEGG